jgi:surface polysaccharide O-acyltransferase-like enzyme
MIYYSKPIHIESKQRKIKTNVCVGLSFLYVFFLWLNKLKDEIVSVKNKNKFFLPADWKIMSKSVPHSCFLLTLDIFILEMQYNHHRTFFSKTNLGFFVNHTLIIHFMSEKVNKRCEHHAYDLLDRERNDVTQKFDSFPHQSLKSWILLRRNSMHSLHFFSSV